MYCITSLARSSSSWMSLAVGDSGSQTRCIMGIILWPGPKVQGRRALLCSGDQSKLFFLCEEDKALLRSKHPAPSFLSPPFCLSCPSYRTDKCTRGWTRRSIHLKMSLRLKRIKPKSQTALVSPSLEELEENAAEGRWNNTDCLSRLLKGSVRAPFE